MADKNNEQNFLSTMEIDARKLSTSSITNKRRKSSVSYEKIRYGNTTKTNTKPESKLEAFDNAANSRRKSSSSTFFTNSMIDNIQERNEVHSRERYRKVLREIYAEEEEKCKNSTNRQEQHVIKTRGKDAGEGTSGRFVSFIQYMSIEHETLLQFLVFLPLILTALYIAIIEQKPLIKYR